MDLLLPSEVKTVQVESKKLKGARGEKKKKHRGIYYARALLDWSLNSPGLGFLIRADIVESDRRFQKLGQGIQNFHP